MNLHEHESSSAAPIKRRFLSGFGVHHVVMVGCVIVMGAGLWYFMSSSGRSPGYGVLFFLLCPLMHLFMGHGGLRGRQILFRRDFRRTLVFLVFSIVIVSTGILAPHIAWGHLPVTARTGSTVIIIADFLLLFAGFRLYVRDVRREEAERRQAEKYLVDSYRYIGVSNRKLEILAEFVERVSVDDNQKTVRDRVGSLMPEVAVSLLGVDAAVLRIIDRGKGRTVTEWWYEGPSPDNRRRIRLHNREVLDVKPDRASGSSILLTDAPEGLSTVAVLAVDRPVDLDDVSRRFLGTMIRLMHILFTFRPSLVDDR